MELSRTGRAVFVLQWVAVLVLPVFVVIGRGLLGAELGWLTVLGVVYGAVLFPILAIPPVLTVCDREVRRAGRTRTAYDIATFVVWAATFVVGISIPDAGDAGPVDSALTVWTGIGNDASDAISAGAAIVVLLAYLASIGVAIAGIVRAHRRPAPDSVTP